MKKLVLSLIFPIINITASLVFILGIYCEWHFLLCMIAGGILPIILTLKFKTDTSKYIVYRLIMLILTVALETGGIALLYFFDLFISIILVFLFPALYLIISSVFFIKKFKDSRERFILFLSNPAMYVVISLIYITATFSVLTGL